MRNVSGPFKCPCCDNPLKRAEIIKIKVSCPLCDSEMVVRDSKGISGSLRYKRYHCKDKKCHGSQSFYEELKPEISTAIPPPEGVNVKYLFCNTYGCNIKYILAIEEPAKA